MFGICNRHLKNPVYFISYILIHSHNVWDSSRALVSELVILFNSRLKTGYIA